jgi:hypothetical protein
MSPGPTQLAKCLWWCCCKVEIPDYSRSSANAGQINPTMQPHPIPLDEFQVFKSTTVAQYFF